MNIDKIYVSPNGSDSIGNGTQENPFLTIQEAHYYAIDNFEYFEIRGNDGYLLLSNVKIDSNVPMSLERRYKNKGI